MLFPGNDIIDNDNSCVINFCQKFPIAAWPVRASRGAIVERVGNPLLTKMMMQLRDDRRLYGIDSKAGLVRQKASMREHYRMVELAQKKDVKKIGTLISEHILA